MYKQESIFEKEMHKILLDLGIKTDYLILARRPDLVLIKIKKRKKQKICRLVYFAVLADQRIKLKEMKK